MIAFLFSLPALAQTTVLQTTNYYVITGATLVDIRQSLERSRPWRNPSDGFTRWHIDWRYEVAASSAGCRCTAFTTTTKITTTLPRWISSTNATSETVRAWADYLAALWKHESGHVQLALDAAAEQHKRINGLGTEADCQTLKDRLNRVAQEVVHEFRRRERDYDERTSHGRREGAILPRSGPSDGQRLRRTPAHEF